MLAAALLGAVVFAVLAIRAPGEGSPVLVAANDIPAGQAIDGRLVQVASVPSSARPEGTLTSLDQLDRVAATRDIPARTILTETLLAPQGLIPSGYSQVIVDAGADTVTALRGDTVHIWGPSQDCSESACPVELLAPNSKIISVTSADQGLIQTGGAATVTVAVPTTSVASVLHANSTGALHFVVPSAIDSKLGLAQSGPPSE